MEVRSKILLVEDDQVFSNLIKGFLSKKDYSISVCNSLKMAVPEIENKTFDLILLDYNLPDGTGFDLIEKLNLLGSKVPVIIMTSFNDVRTAVKAIRSGVTDYITKPVNHEELLMLIEQTVGKKADKSTKSNENNFVKGESPESLELYKQIELVAPTQMSVMIQGESGTGKENVARTIHLKSLRPQGPFVAVDCGALTDELAASVLFGHVKGAFTGAVADKKGEFEAAHKGTLFLDEVGNLSYATQVKLLRVIQEREIQPVGSNKRIQVDVRIITATNEDLKKSMQNGAFREDLFHRLNEFAIYVPPLRSRKEDVKLFVNHFIEQSNADLSKQVSGATPEVMEIFTNYEWPGNLREMKNLVKRSVLLATGNQISLKDLPPEMSSPTPQVSEKKFSGLKDMNEVNERDLITSTLQKVKYNKSKAAALLKIDRKTLYLKILKYGIDC